MANNNKPIFVSEKQLLAIKTFFNNYTEDMLYGGAARWGKSEAIGIILAICIAAFPWSKWLISRTQLADLKATTLSTFYSVLKRFWYWDNSYRDKIRDERHIEFVNSSKLFVIQVNLEPSDPEFDRIGSYGYTGWFLDEGQQMSNKVREVLQGRLSELDGSFETDKKWDWDLAFTIEFIVVEKVLRKNDEDNALYEGKYACVVDNGRNHYIRRRENFMIPYTYVWSRQEWGKEIFTYSWYFKGCIFTGCNPWTNFTRSEFYKPWKAGSLEKYKSFIPAKVNDNPWVDKKYIERLQRLPDTSIRKQRLLYGNFDYDDNPSILYDYNTIEGMFSRIARESHEKYIVVDAARQGKDNTEIGYWEWLHLKEIIKIKQGSLVIQAQKIEQMAHKYGVDITSNIIVDEVWVGWGLVDMLGCKGFIGNSVALQPYEAKFLTYKKQNYSNLRTQSFYYLQKYMKDIAITCDGDTRENIIEELLTVKEADVTNDTKLQIVKKSVMKEELGRSPDFADLLSMRMWFIINEHHNYEIAEDVDEQTATTAEIEDKLLENFFKDFTRVEKKEESSIWQGAF